MLNVPETAPLPDEDEELPPHVFGTDNPVFNKFSTGERPCCRVATLSQVIKITQDPKIGSDTAFLCHVVPHNKQLLITPLRVSEAPVDSVL